MRLYVGNVPWTATQDDLLGRFSTHGSVREARIITDRETGRSRGFAFVTYENAEDGQDAIKEEDGSDFMGRTLRVSEAQAQERQQRSDGSPRAPRSGGEGGSRGGYQTPPPEHDQVQEPRRRRSKRGDRRERA